MAPSPRVRGEGWGGGRPSQSSGRVVGELDGAGAGAVVGFDVDEGDAAVVDLFLGAFEGRADVFRVLDVFAVAAEALGHLVVAGVAEVATGLVALGVGGPAAVQADDDED